MRVVGNDVTLDCGQTRKLEDLLGASRFLGPLPDVEVGKMKRMKLDPSSLSTRPLLPPRCSAIATTSHVMLERLAQVAVTAGGIDNIATRCAVVHCPSRGLSWIELDGRPFAGLCVYTRVGGDTVRVTTEILDDVWPDREAGIV